LVKRGIPVYHVAGNHDTENEPTPESLAVYRRDFGRDYYSFQAGKLWGIVLNSNLIAAPGKVPDEAAKQEAWLREELGKARAAQPAQILVFLHHPLFLKQADEADGYFVIPQAARARHVALLREYGVRHAFAGHLHRDNVASDAGLEMITSGPVGKPLGSASSGVRVAIVRQDRLEHQFYSLGNLPNQISLAPRAAKSAAAK
jgi:serine/threonine-protein phosphatase CPPED1